MQEQVSRGPLSHTTLLWVVGAGYGATVVLVGPAEILAQIVADLGGALEGVTP